MSCGYGAISAPIYFWRGLFTNIKQSKALYWGIFRQKVKMLEFRIAPKQKNLPIKLWNNKKALISSIIFFKARSFVRTFVLYRRGEGILFNCKNTTIPTRKSCWLEDTIIIVSHGTSNSPPYYAVTFLSKIGFEMLVGVLNFWLSRNNQMIDARKVINISFCK